MTTRCLHPMAVVTALLLAVFLTVTPTIEAQTASVAESFDTAAQSVLSPLTTRFRASITGGGHFGFTRYRYDGPGIGSELVFPLDVTLAGVRAEFAVERNSLALWSVAAEVTLGVNDPSDPFTDRDWYLILPGLEVNFSYTESDVDVSMMKLYLEGSRLLMADGPFTLDLVAGVGYQKISQEALGYTGSQLLDYDIDSGLVFHPVSSDLRALTYDISYLTPRLGLKPRLEFDNRFVFEATVAGSPMVYVDDRDKHLLRYFVSEADGRGYGFFADCSLEYCFASGRQFVRLTGDLTVLGADLASGIRWYGDDPIDDADNTGNFVLGVPHDIRSTQYSVGLTVGTVF